MTPVPLEIQWLGRMDYQQALGLQDRLVAQRRQGQIPNQLLLLEHDPVYTIGRTPDQTSLRGESHLLHPVVQINRGGQATYHGPGQLVGYPILDLRDYGQDLHRYLRALEALMIRVCAEYGVEAERRDTLTGAWVAERKIASIGIGVRNWICMHGFALNVCGDLAPFSDITPCGIAGVSMTSLMRECGRPISVEAVASVVSRLFDECVPAAPVTSQGSSSGVVCPPELKSILDGTAHHGSGIPGAAAP
jgi:lipoyl(octanoyl) transferase